MFTTTPEIEFILRTTQQAAQLAKKIQAETITSALTKGDKSPVTIADFAAQALVGRALATSFPNDILIGEEDSRVLRTPAARNTLAAITGFVGGVAPGATDDDVCAWIDRGNAEGGSRYWTVDPIDGTKGFLRKMQYATAFALVEDGEILLGALGCPNMNLDYLIHNDGTTPMAISSPMQSGSLLIAARGQGTWATALDNPTTFTRLHVSQRTDSSQARLLRSYERAHTNTGKIGEIVRALNVVADPIGMDSQAKYAVLAAGHGDMLMRLLSPKMPNYKEKVWDQAAGAIVATEAGGKITDLHGKPLDFAQGRTLANNRGVLASNGHLHQVALDALKKVGT